MGFGELGHNPLHCSVATFTVANSCCCLQQTGASTDTEDAVAVTGLTSADTRCEMPTSADAFSQCADTFSAGASVSTATLSTGAVGNFCRKKLRFTTTMHSCN